MAAPIFAGMASFADNFTKAYSGETRRLSDEEDRKAQRAWMQEQQARQRQDWKESDQLKSDLKDAAAPAAVEQGSGGMIKPDTMDNRDVGLPENQDQPNGGLMQGAFKVKGQSFTDQAQADKAATDYNAPDAVTQRTVQAFRKNGQTEKALSMENAMLDQQSKRLGLSVEQMKFADLQTNKALEKVLQSGPTWYEGAAQFLTDHQMGPLKDIKAKSEVSPDGKTVTMKAIMPDGTEKVTGTYPADDKGRVAFMEKFGALPLETRMSIMRDNIKSERDQANWEKTFQQSEDHFKITKMLQEKQLGVTAGHLQLAKADEARKQALFEQESKIPAAVNKAYSALQERAKIMDTQIYKAQAEGTFKDGDPSSTKLMDDRAKLSADMNKLMNPYIKAAQEKLPGEKGSLPPPAIDSAIRGETAPAQKPNAQPQTAKPLVSMGQVVPIAAPNAPLRTVDGGKTWTLDVPKTIRDPSVKWYREIPNPAYQAVGSKSFASADEAKAAFESLQQ